MGEIVRECFEVMIHEMPVPQNLGELLPWFASLLFTAAVVGTLLDWLKITVQSMGRGLR